MTQEEQEFLLKDLCARLPYNVQIHGIFTDVDYSKDEDEDGFISEKEYDTYLDIETFDWFIHGAANIKPYLRPMESMTEEERVTAWMVGLVFSHNVERDTWAISSFSPEGYDWLNANHFDYRNLISKGLALKATKDMYKED